MAPRRENGGFVRKFYYYCYYPLKVEKIFRLIRSNTSECLQYDKTEERYLK